MEKKYQRHTFQWLRPLSVHTFLSHFNMSQFPPTKLPFSYSSQSFLGTVIYLSLISFHTLPGATRGFPILLQCTFWNNRRDSHILFRCYLELNKFYNNKITNITEENVKAKLSVFSSYLVKCRHVQWELNVLLVRT